MVLRTKQLGVVIPPSSGDLIDTPPLSSAAQQPKWFARAHRDAYVPYDLLSSYAVEQARLQQLEIPSDCATAVCVGGDVLVMSAAGPAREFINLITINNAATPAPTSYKPHLTPLAHPALQLSSNFPCPKDWSRVLSLPDTPLVAVRSAHSVSCFQAVPVVAVEEQQAEEADVEEEDPTQTLLQPTTTTARRRRPHGKEVEESDEGFDPRQTKKPKKNKRSKPPPPSATTTQRRMQKPHQAEEEHPPSNIQPPTPTSPTTRWQLQPLCKVESKLPIADIAWNPVLTQRLVVMHTDASLSELVLQPNLNININPENASTTTTTITKNLASQQEDLIPIWSPQQSSPSSGTIYSSLDALESCLLGTTNNTDAHRGRGGGFRPSASIYGKRPRCVFAPNHPRRVLCSLRSVLFGVNLGRKRYGGHEVLHRLDGRELFTALAVAGPYTSSQSLSTGIVDDYSLVAATTHRIILLDLRKPSTIVASWDHSTLDMRPPNILHFLPPSDTTSLRSNFPTTRTNDNDSSSLGATKALSIMNRALAVDTWSGRGIVCEWEKKERIDSLALGVPQTSTLQPRDTPTAGTSGRPFFTQSQSQRDIQATEISTSTASIIRSGGGEGGTHIKGLSIEEYSSAALATLNIGSKTTKGSVIVQPALEPINSEHQSEEEEGRKEGDSSQRDSRSIASRSIKDSRSVRFAWKPSFQASIRAVQPPLLLFDPGLEAINSPQESSLTNNTTNGRCSELLEAAARYRWGKGPLLTGDSQHQERDSASPENDGIHVGVGARLDTLRVERQQPALVGCAVVTRSWKLLDQELSSSFQNDDGGTSSRENREGAAGAVQVQQQQQQQQHPLTARLFTSGDILLSVLHEDPPLPPSSSTAPTASADGTAAISQPQQVPEVDAQGSLMKSPALIVPDLSLPAATTINKPPSHNTTAPTSAAAYQASTSSSQGIEALKKDVEKLVSITRDSPKERVKPSLGGVVELACHLALVEEAIRKYRDRKKAYDQQQLHEQQGVSLEKGQDSDEDIRIRTAVSGVLEKARGGVTAWEVHHAMHAEVERHTRTEEMTQKDTISMDVDVDDDDDDNRQLNRNSNSNNNNDVLEEEDGSKVLTTTEDFLNAARQKIQHQLQTHIHHSMHSRQTEFLSFITTPQVPSTATTSKVPNVRPAFKKLQAVARPATSELMAELHAMGLIPLAPHSRCALKKKKEGIYTATNNESGVLTELPGENWRCELDLFPTAAWLDGIQRMIFTSVPTTSTNRGGSGAKSWKMVQHGYPLTNKAPPLIESSSVLSLEGDLNSAEERRGRVIDTQATYTTTTTTTTTTIPVDSGNGQSLPVSTALMSVAPPLSRTSTSLGAFGGEMVLIPIMTTAGTAAVGVDNDDGAGPSARHVQQHLQEECVDLGLEESMTRNVSSKVQDALNKLKAAWGQKQQQQD